MEIWRDIEGYNGDYQVSNLGRARSKKRYPQIHILKPLKTPKGKYVVCIARQKQVLARLVVETFTGQKLTQNEYVRYKDNDYSNCCIDNLYVITRSEEKIQLYKNRYDESKIFDYYGKKLTLAEIAKTTGVPCDRLKKRVYRLGWSVYEAVSTPVGIYK